MASFPDIILIAHEARYSVKDAAIVYFLVGHHFGFNYLRDSIELLKSRGDLAPSGFDFLNRGSVQSSRTVNHPYFKSE